MVSFKLLLLGSAMIVAVHARGYGSGASKTNANNNKLSGSGLSGGIGTGGGFSFAGTNSGGSSKSSFGGSGGAASSSFGTGSSGSSSSAASNFGENDGQFKESTGSSSREKILAAVQTKHTFETRPVDIPFEDIEPQIIEVEGGALPLEIHFKSSSSRIKVHQSHESSGAGEVEQTTSDEEPHRLIHTVNKPIISEVREVITPYRRVIQEIQPVQEEIHTIVAKGEPRRQFDRNQSKQSGGGSAASTGGSGFRPLPSPKERAQAMVGGSSSFGTGSTAPKFGGSGSSTGGGFTQQQQTSFESFEQKRY